MTAISDKAAALSLAGFDLGTALTGELDAPGGGKYKDWTNASIYWSPATGAHESHGDIRARYRLLGGPGSFLGYPLTDETTTPEGRGQFNHFQNGSLYWDRNHTGEGAYVVFPPPSPCNTPPEDDGRWTVPPYGSGVVGVHAALLRTNRVLFFTYLEPPPGSPSVPERYGASSTLNLTTGITSTPSVTGGGTLENLFCAGQAFLGDGRLLVAGGERDQPGIRDESVKALHAFVPGGSGGGHWEHVADCARGRWYAQVATLPDGKVMIIGGSVRATLNALSNATFELYDPADDSVSPEYPAPIVSNHSSYPFVVVLPNNKVLVHAGTRTTFLNLPTLTFDALELEAAPRTGRNSRTYPSQGTAVLLPLLPDATPPYRAKVMMIGGAGGGDAHLDRPATRTCEILDLGAASPSWQLAPQMSERRIMPDCVLLPDGTVFVTNGSSKGGSDLGASPVYPAEIYDPASNSWTTVCHMITPRLYHATALLLPDGRVLTAGTDTSWNPVPYNQAQTRIEVFSPPYLFRGSRPHIGTTPGFVAYDDELVVPTNDAASIERVAFLRCGSVTHSFNSDQRYVGLTIVARDGDSVTVVAPPDGAVAPPGYYLLFLLNADGVPSTGKMVRLGEPALIKRKELLKYEIKEFEKWRDDFKPRKELVENPFEQKINEGMPQLTDLLDVVKRIEGVEKQLARATAFIERQERPELGAHAGEGAAQRHAAPLPEPPSGGHVHPPGETCPPDCEAKHVHHFDDDDGHEHTHDRPHSHGSEAQAKGKKKKK